MFYFIINLFQTGKFDEKTCNSHAHVILVRLYIFRSFVNSGFNYQRD